MDIDNLRGLGTIFCMLAFTAVVYWAYGPSRKDYFDTAGNLPFEDAGKMLDSQRAARAEDLKNGGAHE